MKGKKFESPKKASDCIAKKSEKLGNTRGYASPFAIGAREAGKNFPNMGKADDIAVICA